MKFDKKVLKKAALSAAIAGALGLSTAPAQAEVINMNWNGVFTMLNASGTALVNSDASTNQWYGNRTDVSGTMTFDTSTGAGSGTVQGFSFFGSGLAKATSVTMQAIGNGQGGPGTLVLGNMGFNWNGNNGIPVSIVMDAAGLMGAIQNGVAAGDTISGTGATPASNDTVFGGGRFSYTMPIGAAPVATTTWNTTNVSGGVTLGTNPSGTLPLVADTVVDATNNDVGIGGSPMQTAPFAGYNANFDITSLTVTSVSNPSAVPIPAAVWLFGSGLVGLVGVARRKRSIS